LETLAEGFSSCGWVESHEFSLQFGWSGYQGDWKAAMALNCCQIIARPAGDGGACRAVGQ